MKPLISTSDILDQSPHYIQAIAELGEERHVVAQEDIFAVNGMKLIAKGTRINSSQSERLKLHKLSLPLDLLLSTQDGVDAARLTSDANTIHAEYPALERLTRRSGDPQGFRRTLNTLWLPSPFLFRMTVMRERRNPLYQHTLRMAMITHAIAVSLSLSERDKDSLLLASLSHDFGEMHIDPVMLAAGPRITREERRFIHVHPITGYLVLQNMKEIPAATLQAVLHHHERLDGSGYPYGLKSAQIHPLAKILRAADVMEGVVRRADWQRQDVLLRLNQRRLDPAVINALRGLLREDTNQPRFPPVTSDASVQLAHVMEVLRVWPAYSITLGEQALAAPELMFLNERMDMLRSLVLQSGINPEDPETLLKLANEDGEVLNELQDTLAELEWLMTDIANETERRITRAERFHGITGALLDQITASLLGMKQADLVPDFSAT